MVSTDWRSNKKRVLDCLKDMSITVFFDGISRNQKLGLYECSGCFGLTNHTKLVNCLLGDESRNGRHRDGLLFRYDHVMYGLVEINLNRVDLRLDLEGHFDYLVFCFVLKMASSGVVEVEEGESNWTVTKAKVSFEVTLNSLRADTSLEIGDSDEASLVPRVSIRFILPNYQDCV